MNGVYWKLVQPPFLLSPLNNVGQGRQAQSEVVFKRFHLSLQACALLVHHFVCLHQRFLQVEHVTVRRHLEIVCIARLRRECRAEQVAEVLNLVSQLLEHVFRAQFVMT